MAKATTTIRQRLNLAQGEWLHANQVLFNRVAQFYFDVIQAHIGILDLSNKEALTALEKLTHRTDRNRDPIMPLDDVQEDIPAMSRRAAIHAALGSARSFHSHLAKWKREKAKAQAKGKGFAKRPPTPPSTWNKSVTLYAGMWKERTASSICIKVWTGSCWSWIRVRITGREIPEGFDLCSPQLVKRGTQWCLHTPVEKKITTPGKVEKQIKQIEHTRLCAIDLNINEQLAVCTIRDAKGSTLATRFIGGGQRVSGFRKKQLGRIARNRSRTGNIAENEQDNAALWQKLRNVDENLSHLVSKRIVEFCQEYEATVLVFEHLGNLKPEKGKYSRRGNSKRAFWMKGHIFKYVRYKAYNTGIITTRVSPRNTSRKCANCGGFVARYSEWQEPVGYQYGAPLFLCHDCGKAGNADRNASLMIGNRLFERYSIYFPPEKPQASHSARVEQSTGVVPLQEPKVEVAGHVTPSTGHESSNGQGTAQNGHSSTVEPVRVFTQLLLFPIEP